MEPTHGYRAPYPAHQDSNISMLETAEASASEYAKSERSYYVDDDISTTYLPANADSPAARTHDGQYYDGEYDYDQAMDGYAYGHAKPDPLADSQASIQSLGYSITRDFVALLTNYAAIGVIHALFQSMVYPFLKIYLNMDEYRAAAAETLIALPWSFKLAAALVSDFVPIRGQRRMPYLYIGWALCGLFALVIACIPSETPYLRNGNVANGEAPSAGSKYIALFFVSSLGLVIVDATCDGILVEYSHREVESRRGSRLLMCYVARYIGHAVMTFLFAFLCNDASFGGSFAWASSPNLMLLFAVTAAAIAIAATRFFMIEGSRQRESRVRHPSRASTTTGDDATDRPTHAQRSSLAAGPVQTLWKFLQRRSTWQMMIFVFIARVCLSYYSSNTKVVYETWLSISPLLSNLFTVVNSFVYAGAAMLLQRSHLMTSWRRVIQGSVAVSIVLALIPMLFIVWNIVRSGFLTLLTEQLAAFVDATAYFVVLLAILEATEYGTGVEGTSFALFTSIANAAVPFATSLSQSVGSHFDAYDSEWVNDTAAVRWRVVWAFFVWVLFRLALLAALPLLPEQKRGMQTLKSNGQAHRLAAIYVNAAAAFVLLWALFTTLLASFETTACLTVAGGEGC